MPKVLIAVPTMGNIHTFLVAQLLRWQNSKLAEVSFHFTFQVSPHDRARNQIAATFLKGDFTHLFMIDSDTLPPPDALQKLLDHNLPFVTGMTPIAREHGAGWEFFDNCFKERVTTDDGEVQTHIAERDTGLQKIYRCGAACLMIKREVFEKIEPPYFRFESNEENTENKRSEDIYFCDKVRKAGFELYADTSIHCGHYKSIML